MRAPGQTVEKLLKRIVIRIAVGRDSVAKLSMAFLRKADIQHADET